MSNIQIVYSEPLSYTATRFIEILYVYKWSKNRNRHFPIDKYISSYVHDYIMQALAEDTCELYADILAGEEDADNDEEKKREREETLTSLIENGFSLAMAASYDIKDHHSPKEKLMKNSFSDWQINREETKQELYEELQTEYREFSGKSNINYSSDRVDDFCKHCISSYLSGIISERFRLLPLLKNESKEYDTDFFKTALSHEFWEATFIDAFGFYKDVMTMAEAL